MIPSHLSKLPMWRGLPVPYINCWGDEVDDHKWVLGYDPHVQGEAWFSAPGCMGTGDAFLAKQCLQRQRECAVLGLCQVCHRIISKGRWLLAWGASAEIVTMGGDELTAVTEPWLCSRCVPYVLQICPGVRKRIADEGLTVIRVERHELLVSTGWHDDHGESVVAAMWVKIVPTSGEHHTPERAMAALS